MEIVKAEDFGVKEQQAKELTTGLESVKSERELLIEAYKDVITLEVTQDNLKTFKELRLKIVKNRTQGIEKWHKASKAYFLAGGKFCDAIKNKEILINTDMESKLMDAEKYFENLEKERIEKLTEERKAELIALEVSELELPSGLGEMNETVWKNYLSGVELALKTRKEAEKKAELERIEAERVEKLHNERKESITPYWNFIPSEFKQDNFGKLTNSEWKERFDWTVSEKEKHDKEQLRIKAENEKLKKEAEAKEKARLAEEKKRKEKEESDQKERERLAKIEADKQAKIKAEQDAKLKVEREAKEKLEAELKAKEEAEEKAKQEEADRLKKEAEEHKKLAKAKALAPDRKKFNEYLLDIYNIELGDYETTEINSHAEKFTEELKGLLSKYKL